MFTRMEFQCMCPKNEVHQEVLYSQTYNSDITFLQLLTASSYLSHLFLMQIITLMTMKTTFMHHDNPASTVWDLPTSFVVSYYINYLLQIHAYCKLHIFIANCQSVVDLLK